jgi:hypothetical protein
MRLSTFCGLHRDTEQYWPSVVFLNGITAMFTTSLVVCRTLKIFLNLVEKIYTLPNEVPAFSTGFQWLAITSDQ